MKVSRTTSPSRSLYVTLAVYAAITLASLAAFAMIRNFGERLQAPPVGSSEFSAGTTAPGDVFLRVLIALAAIIIVGQVLSKLFALLSQPPVIGEVVAGILLGPSLLGQELSSLVLPPSVAPYLGVIAQIGVVLYMFLVGLELNPALLKSRVATVIATSHASILAPFLLGTLLSLYLYPRLSHGGVSFTSFSLFLGVAMSITAFPVLARILTDYRMSQTELGVIALSSAAVADITAWCLLALVVGVVKAEVGQGLFVAAGALAYIAGMFVVGRPILKWVAKRWDSDQQTRSVAALVFIGLLLSALSAEGIGIHAIFGSFLMGTLIPHDSALARALTRQLEHVVTILLLPAFFAFIGMRTRIDLLVDSGQWLICGWIILTAVVGKFGGTLVAARLTGLGWRDSAVLGTLMNTRGLMELIVLNVGLDLGVISPTIFAMMVLMALVTTMLTSPIVRLLKPESVGRG